jgi:methionyl-tRNA formyltransferase
MARLRVIFMGTPGFAAAALKALVDAGHDILAAYTQPPRPKGRGLEVQPSAVQELAMELGIPVRNPVSLKTAEEIAAFRALDADIAVVAAYGLILPKAILDAPRLGCLNIHASLLPRWRGAAPIQRAIMAGDMETGITIMQMAEGLDTGPMLLREAVPISPEMDAGTLHDELAALGGRMIVDALERLPDGLPAQPQPEDGTTYAAKITKADCRIDWTRDAVELDRQIRALAPAPGAFTELAGERLGVLAAELMTGFSGPPGITLDDQLAIGCGSGVLRLLLVKRAGKRAMSAEEMLRGFPVPKGALLGKAGVW